LTNAGVLVALLLVKLLNIPLIDPLIAAAMAIYIMYTAIMLHVDALKIMLDARIPDEQMAMLEEVLNRYSPYIQDYHHLRTRTDGNKLFADVHLRLCRDLTLHEAHSLGDMIEKEIRNACEGRTTDIIIHFEPCKNPENCRCQDCKGDAARLILQERGRLAKSTIKDEEPHA
jgi:divalent metal cation (Fe/Co/Zn/Cd) transporter